MKMPSRLNFFIFAPLVLVLPIPASGATAVAPSHVRIALINTSTALANTRPELPQSVYTDFADTNKNIINMPAGDFYLKSPLLLARSNVTVNFAGCRLYIDPSDNLGGNYPIQVASRSDRSRTYLPSSSQTAPSTRYISHATGIISEATTTLKMDPNEIVSFAPGEVVLIWAGVTPSDPYEAQAFIPATVQSVSSSTGVITFTRPLGKNIANYGSLGALRGLAASGQEYKVGAWGTYPDESNFAKGYGIDHGIERFVGGMTHDVTLNDPQLFLDAFTDISTMPNGMWDLSAVAVSDFTINRAAIHNPQGSALHFWRSFNVVVNKYSLTGAGIAKIWNTKTSEACALSIWGGDGYTFRDLSIAGTDMIVANVEVEPTNIWINRVFIDVKFTSRRTYVSSPILFGFSSVGDAPRVTDARVRAVTTGGSAHNYFSYSPLVLDGTFTLEGSSPTDYLNWGFQKEISLKGTVTVGGATYGPAVTRTLSYTVLHGAGFRDVHLPAGLYTSGNFQFVNDEGVRGVTDSDGNDYWPTAKNAGITYFNPRSWFCIAPGDSGLAAYGNKFFRFWLNNIGIAADASVRFTVTYLPKNV